MNIKFAAIASGMMMLLLTMCSSASFAKEYKSQDKNVQIDNAVIFETIKQKHVEKTILEEELLAYQKELVRQQELNNALLKNGFAINSAIKNIKKHVGKTWYVFSGSSPSGWDCSGLVLWFYSNLGISLEHSATKQSKNGILVKTPKPGDIVSFSYKSYESSYHVGIYLSKDTMIHAGGKSGDKTEITSISSWAGKNSNFKYIRILESN